MIKDNLKEENNLLCKNILAFSIKRNMYSSRVKSDRVDFSLGLVKQSHDLGNPLWYVAGEYDPKRNAGIMNVPRKLQKNILY